MTKHSETQFRKPWLPGDLQTPHAFRLRLHMRTLAHSSTSAGGLLGPWKHTVIDQPAKTHFLIY